MCDVTVYFMLVKFTDLDLQEEDSRKKDTVVCISHIQIESDKPTFISFLREENEDRTFYSLSNFLIFKRTFE